MKKTKYYIDPKVLRELRSHYNYSRNDLHIKTREYATYKNGLKEISQRTIQEIEEHSKSDKLKVVHENTVQILCRVFSVIPNQLSGILDIDLSSDLVKVESEISQQASLNFDVVQKKYGASFDEIVEISPFLFSIFAEKSVKYAKKRYRKLKSIIDKCKYESLNINKLLDYLDIKEEDLENDDESNSFFTSLEFLENVYLLEDLEYFIRTKDIFEINEGADCLGKKEYIFAYYLSEIAKKEKYKSYLKVTSLNDNSSINNEKSHFKYLKYSNGQIPETEVLYDEIDKITLGSSKAKKCLLKGYCNISEIPNFEENNSISRVQFLENLFDEKEGLKINKKNKNIIKETK